MTPKTVASSTSIVPRSGCSRISAAGSEATASMPRTSRWRTSRWRQEPSVRSATTSAMPMTTESLANSAGWIDMPAMTIHDREPLMVEPMTSTSSRPIRETTYTGGREDAHPAVVGGRDEDGQHDADGDVDQVAAQERLGVAAGEDVALGGGRPHEHRAEHEQRGGGDQQQPVQPRHAGQARLGADRARAGQRGAVARGRGRPAGCEERHQESLSFAAASGAVDGGRIEPSSAKTGSRSGGATPGIAASSGTHLHALDAVEGLVDLADGRAGGARAGAALGDHHHHDVVLGVGRHPRGRLLAVDLGRAGLGADRDLVERELQQPPGHGADLGARSAGRRR